MNHPPNSRHSALLNNLCENLELIDPFRALWPNRKDYSYIPYGTRRLNRSRIDFFLASESALQHITRCEISETTQGKQFDHKHVTLEFNGENIKKIRGPQISNGTIKSEVTETIVKNALLECYAHHLSANIRVPELGRALIDCGRVWYLSRKLGPDTAFLPDGELTENLLIEREEILTEIELIHSRYDFDDLCNLPLSVEDDIFYDTLLNNIRNEVSSYQNFLSKSKKKRRNELVDTIRNEKNVPDPDILQINVLERELLEITEKELQVEFESHRFYELLNMEKITPQFMKLARADSSEFRLGDLCKNDGSRFSDHTERTDYIVNYFEQVYSAPTENQVRPSIEEFLGPDTCNSRLVQDSKLTEEESDEMELELSINELDVALSQCKNGTACGMDGISYKFLKTYWRYLKYPLLKYCQALLQTRSVNYQF